MLGCYGVFPRVSRPRLLFPLGSRSAAREALHRYSSSRPLVGLLMRTLTFAAAVGVIRRAWPHRLYVSASPGTDTADPLIDVYLRNVLGWPDLQVAVLFSPGRPQKKPVLQLIRTGGETRGYAKVGWNDLTRGLVRAEAETLAGLQATRPSTFSVPNLIHLGACGDLELLVVAAQPRRAWYFRRETVPRSLPLEATCELTTLGPRKRETLIESRYWAARTAELARLTAVSALAGALPGLLLETIGSRYGNAELDFGFAHGDWVPWNMAETRDGLFVWDWERCEPSAPVGLDAMHFLFQLYLNFRKHSPATAVEESLSAGRRVLPTLGVDAAQAQLLLLLHLLQITLRLEEGRAGGIGGVIPAERYRRALDAIEVRQGAR